jgi:hypothetical protein
MTTAIKLSTVTPVEPIITGRSSGASIILPNSYISCGEFPHKALPVKTSLLAKGISL